MVFKNYPRQRVCQNFSQHSLGGDVLHNHLIILNALMDEVIAFFNVLVCVWCSGFLARASAPLLLTRRRSGSVVQRWSLAKMFFNHNSSLHKSVRNLYSDSVIERETVGCFLDFQDIFPSPIRKVYAEVDLLSWVSSAQLESVYLQNFIWPSRPRQRNFVEIR